MVAVALLACGKAKLTWPAPASELYTGNLFTAGRGHIEAGTWDRWWILSARWGLVDPRAELAPYDTTMTDKAAVERARWGDDVVADLAGHVGTGADVTVDVFAGRAYVAPLTAASSRTSWQIRDVLAGLTLGQRLHFYATARHQDR